MMSHIHFKQYNSHILQDIVNNFIDIHIDIYFS